MSDSSLKKQINSLRNTLFDKDKVKETLREIYNGDELILTMGAGNLFMESDNIISFLENE